MSKFNETIKQFADGTGLLISSQIASPDNFVNLIRQTDNGLVSYSIKVELVGEQLVVFSSPNSVSGMFSSLDNLPKNFSSELLHRNSRTKGFWGIVEMDFLREKRIIICYCHQVYLSELNATLFKEIIREIEDESQKIQQQFE